MPDTIASQVRRRVRRALLATLALAFALGPAVSNIADAHAFLVRTTPRPGERLAGSPPAIVLEFSEPVVAGSEEIAVRAADGKAVPVGPVERAGGGAQVRASLPPLDQAVYLVEWRVLADDAHQSAGEFAFAVGPGGRLPTMASGASSAVSWPSVVASWLLLAGLALALGGLASEVAVWGPVARRHGLAVPRAPVGPGLLLALGGGAVSFVLVAAALGGGGPLGGLDPRDWLAALRTRPGLATAAVLILVGHALWGAPLRTRPWALLPVTGAVVAAAWRGHSGVSTEMGAWWAAPANALHLAGAGLWVGALAHLALVLWRWRGAEMAPVLGEAARRYAALALPTVLLVLAAGLATALAELSAPAELVETTYGRVLLLKLLLVAAALALALVARWQALPDAAGSKLGLLHRLTRFEALALVATVSVSAVLVNAATPRAAVAEAELLGPPPLEGPVIRLASQAGQLAVFLAAAEGELQVRVIAPGGGPPGDARLQVEGRGPSGTGLDIYPRSCGRGCFSMGFPWQEGTTRLGLAVSASEWQDGSVEFAVPWPPAPAAQELLGRVIETMGAQPEVWLTERVSSGPDMASGPYTARLTGPQFVAQELYVASGADDVRTVPDDSRQTSLVLFLPGSWTWYRLCIDAQHRLRRESIVNPGHLIERTFSYEPLEPGAGAG